MNPNWNEDYTNTLAFILKRAKALKITPKKFIESELKQYAKDIKDKKDKDDFFDRITANAGPRD